MVFWRRRGSGWVTPVAYTTVPARAKLRQGRSAANAQKAAALPWRGLQRATVALADDKGKVMVRLSLALLISLTTASVAGGQTVAVAPLTAPDVFSGGSRASGLGPDLWAGSSAAVVRRLLPVLADRPLSPAARALALQVLGAGARAPDGAAEDRALAVARARTLLALGDAGAVAASVERLPNIGADPALAQLLAEAALILGDEARACQIEAGMTSGRSDLYWLRLRAYCQATGGKADAAQLSLTLAHETGSDAAFLRLMTSLLVGADPGAPSVRNGVNLALSRRLGLKLSTEGAPAAIVQAIRPPVQDPPPQAEAIEADPMGSARRLVELGDLAGARAVRQTLVAEDGRWTPADLALLDVLIAVAGNEAAGFDLKRLSGLEGQGLAPLHAAQWLVALGAPTDPQTRQFLSARERGRAEPNAVNLAALALAAEARATGETALLAVAVASDGGAMGPGPSDRVAIIRALRQVGLDRAATAFAVEGLTALMTPQ